MVRGGGHEVGRSRRASASANATNDAPGPLENDWLLVGNGVVAFARIIAFDDGSMLSMAITLDTGTQSRGAAIYPQEGRTEGAT